MTMGESGMAGMGDIRKTFPQCRLHKRTSMPVGDTVKLSLEQEERVTTQINGSCPSEG
jgi:hypothetical protein